MTDDRVTGIRIRGFRCLNDVALPLDGLTALIGENGSGKSSLLEAIEVLHRASQPNFVEAFERYHGGLTETLRAGSERMEFEVRLDGSGEPLVYHFGLRNARGRTAVAFEHLHRVGRRKASTRRRQRAATGHGTVGPVGAERLLSREGGEVRVGFPRAKVVPPGTVDDEHLLLTFYGQQPPDPAFSRVMAALGRIEVHLPFDVLPEWSRRERSDSPGARGSVQIRPLTSLPRYGTQLANAYYALRNERSSADWEQTMELVRLGLGPFIEDVGTQVSPGGGHIAIKVKYAFRPDYATASQLSDGTLAYLTFVALYRLRAHQSLTAFDEPETHLHPSLLIRVLGCFESMARTRPVVLATHSDRLLDALSDPAASAVLCELDERGDTRLLRPDSAGLTKWLEHYRGLGEVRTEGFERSVMREEKRP